MKNFDVIKDKINSSTLSPDDKLAMINAFGLVPDQALEMIRQLIEKDQSWIEKLNDNRKKKLEAFSKGNEALWKQILAEEKKYIADLTYNLD